MAKHSGEATEEVISLIVTVLNESTTIEALLISIAAQTRLPDEVVLVDGGSSDQTVEKMHAFAINNPELSIRVLQQKGNRSVGRNAAIQAATSDLIAITDAGCVAEPTWLEELLKTYSQHDVEVVSGYYRAEPKTRLQEAIVPYVLVMPDAVNPDAFLPATRSMLVEKAVWVRAGGFDEALSDNEDYAFAKRLEALQVPRAFAPKAVVVWRPVSTMSQFFNMLYRFAQGDIYAGIVRPKVVLLFVRYLFALLLTLVAVFSTQSYFQTIFPISPPARVVLYSVLVSGLVFYLAWAVIKNFRYAKSAWYWLPVLQLLADAAVLSGSVSGLRQRVAQES